MRKCLPDGPVKATIMFVGEAPGADEEIEGVPFVGSSGQLLQDMCLSVKIDWKDVRRTNVCKWRPPGNEASLWFKKQKRSPGADWTLVGDRWLSPEMVEGYNELAGEITQTDPTVICAVGNIALWALTGQDGISKYRGSTLESKPLYRIDSAGNPTTQTQYKVIPIYHPAAIMRQWAFRAPTGMDLQRVEKASKIAGFPKRHRAYTLRPTFNEVMKFLTAPNEGIVAGDIETRSGYMTCLSFAWSESTAICIPFVQRTLEGVKDYWTKWEEIEIRKAIRNFQTNPKVELVYQNGMYDAQYFIREDGYCPNILHDTMLAQHTLFPGTPKDLNYLSSLYRRNHIFWKDDAKDGKAGGGTWNADGAYWGYNCDDSTALMEILPQQLHTLAEQRQLGQYEFLMSLYKPVLQMMTTGLRVDWNGIDKELPIMELEKEVAAAQVHFRWGEYVNPGSAPQLKKIFYDELGVKPILHPKTRKPTLDEEALRKIVKDEPWTELLAGPILAYRQAQTYISTYLKQRRSPDGRLHASFNIGGQETFRFSSTSNAHWEGCNAQNLPPRFRQYILPDPGMELEEWDLDRADAQIVAWEADEPRLKEVLKRGDNLHVANCRLMFPHTKGWSEEAIKLTAASEDPSKKFYTMTKSGVHAIHYLVFARSLARTLGCTVHEADRHIERWLSEHPAIKKNWHDRIELQLQTTRTVENKFGFKRFYFDRMSVKLVQEALAWIPQSTVALVISKGLKRIYDNLPQIDLLVHGHDSLLMQVPIPERDQLRNKIREQMSILIPYEDPLVIPVGGEASEKNWLDCKNHPIPEPPKVPEGEDFYEWIS